MVATERLSQRDHSSAAAAAAAAVEVGQSSQKVTLKLEAQSLMRSSVEQ